MFAPPLLAAAGLEEELSLQLCELALAPPPPPQERFSPPQHAANAFATVFIIIQHISVLFDLRDFLLKLLLKGEFGRNSKLQTFQKLCVFSTSPAH